MADTTTTETTVAADDAERARAAADQAAAAATSAAALAAVEAANVKDQAASKIEAIEGGLSEWQNSIQRQHESLAQRADALEATLRQSQAETTALLQSIQAKLAPPPEPLTSPPNVPTEAADNATPSPAAPEPESPPARRRAHRWI
jgi:hypothetical protein